MEVNAPSKTRGDWISGTNVYTRPYDKVVSYWCFSPSLAMKQLLKYGLHSLIMTSGTLAPLDGFIAQLQIPIPIQLENPHIIDESQVYVGIVKRVSILKAIYLCLRQIIIVLQMEKSSERL